MEYLASGFKNIDESDDFAKYVDCLKLQHSIEFFKTYKKDSHEMLNLYEGLSVLDVGCGLGEDLINISNRVGLKGSVVGLDSSKSFLKHAEENIKDSPTNIKLVYGNALDLKFNENSFDRCKIDRTLQHISEPKGALSEMYRVLKPGGIMLAFDNDWETFTFSCTNRELVRRVSNYWCDSFSSGWVGRYLYGYFKEIGLRGVKVYPRTLILNGLEDSDKIFDLFRTLEHVVEKGLISDSQADEIRSEMRKQDASNLFFSSYTGFIVVGQK